MNPRVYELWTLLSVSVRADKDAAGIIAPQEPQYFLCCWEKWREWNPPWELPSYPSSVNADKLLISSSLCFLIYTTGANITVFQDGVEN